MVKSINAGIVFSVKIKKENKNYENYINFVRCFTCQSTNSPRELRLFHLKSTQVEVNVLYQPLLWVNHYWITANNTVRIERCMPWESDRVVWWFKGYVSWFTRIYEELKKSWIIKTYQYNPVCFFLLFFFQQQNKNID